ncbi:hypothetical protein HJC23_001011 [Cyclotella cryptica]|uniref:EamA domain-containing protein n=1 Tax=Cyclotella cryptica TaxID=29204 RepID=A0ABD3NXN9_9STRA|eukprot:CCRYP_018869-RA/>CCRYP_018869-RA protein AED:0.13 eAED:0.13 QI:0/-1/0/1/-1/1/1/0/486
MGVASGGGRRRSGSGRGILPYLALITSQFIVSSWHVLGKHVMHQVPYLTPIAFVLARTGITACMLLTLGRVYEGPVAFPPLFRDNISRDRCSSESTKSSKGDRSNSIGSAGETCIENGQSPNVSLDTSINAKASNIYCQQQRPIKRRKRTSYRLKDQIIQLRKRILSSVSKTDGYLLPAKMHTTKLRHNENQSPIFNPEAIQIISAGLSGMLLLPVCYTTGLILTNPTVTSVWDGPMIPLGVFCAAVGLGMEKTSQRMLLPQVLSLLLAVGGSLIVLLVDFVGAHNERTHEDGTSGSSRGDASHWQFIQGNIVLVGIVAAYSAMALLQKQLNHYPPITLTGWMFGSGFMGCFCLLVVDYVLEHIRGVSITGCTIKQAICQLSIALSVSPTFRYGLMYACLFVGGTCFSISSYASSHLESSVITLFAACQPPITAVLEWIWEGKELGGQKIFGMVCVCAGMVCFTHVKRIETRFQHSQTESWKIDIN